MGETERGIVFKRPSSDGIFRGLTASFAFAIALILSLLVAVLVIGSGPVWNKFGLSFLTGTTWDPVKQIFGALPYVLGTLVTSMIAIAIGVPLSIGIAIFVSEMAPETIHPRGVPNLSLNVKGFFSSAIELLAAVPSVIYGLWGLFVFRFWVLDYVETPLSKYLGSIPVLSGTPFGLDILTAGLILAIMIIPTVSSISREVMSSVPRSQREAAYSIGATRWEAVRIGVLGYARSGIFGAAILGLGRAVGETMAVTMVIGNAIGAQAVPTSLFRPGQTMSSLIANEFNEADPTSLHPAALIGVGLVLFMFALAINVVAQLLVWRVLKVQAGAVE
ncbi:MAG TPA: phosphate ABC transporter permease subunit PstC [Candidatus Bathyarchaeia archaeon]|nr:phosphate ABC transporter permease subunit PstC [Candidatus Bathyarchaeia archaeon]